MKKSLLFLGIALILLTVSCQKSPEPAKEKQQPVTQQTEQKAEEPKETLETTQINEDTLGEKKDDFSSKSIDELNKENILEDVYFEFDKSRLTPKTREVLKKHAEWLKQHPTVKILIEGHCDERGTEQYNLALGDRRANAVKNYLISLGISPDRLKTISYGEMFPKVKGHNEWAWSQNRRCHFVIIEK